MGDLVVNLTVDVAQLVRVLDCGSRGRGFKSRLPPQFLSHSSIARFLWIQTPVAQLDRASDFESAGRGFESLRACHFFDFLICS